MKACVIVLNTNEKHHLETCLPSLLNQTFKDFEIILSDNGSTDESVNFVKKKFPTVKILENKKNYGFAKGNNLAAKVALENKVDYIAFLNPDTEVDRNWLGELIKVAESNPEIGACTSKALLFDNRDILDSAGGVLNYLGHAWSIGFNDEDKGQYGKREISFACGGYSLFKREVLEKVGLFDEDYFIYCEDSDLSWRTRLAGYKIYFAPRSIVYHKYAFNLNNKIKLYYLERNRITTLLKNYNLKTLLLISPALLILELSILSYALITGWFWMKVKGYLWNLKYIRKTLKKRSEIQSKRKVPDSEIVKLYVGTIDFSGIKNPLLDKILNPILNCYWSFIKRFI